MKFILNWPPWIFTSQVEQFRQIFIRWARYDPMHGLSSRECPGCGLRSKPQKLQLLDGLLEKRNFSVETVDFQARNNNGLVESLIAYAALTVWILIL